MEILDWKDYINTVEPLYMQKEGLSCQPPKLQKYQLWCSAATIYNNNKPNWQSNIKFWFPVKWQKKKLFSKWQPGSNFKISGIFHFPVCFQNLKVEPFFACRAVLRYRWNYTRECNAINLTGNFFESCKFSCVQCII